MDLAVVLVFVSVFLICYYFTTGRRNLPPGPFCVPFIGSIFVVMKMMKAKTTMARFLFREETKKYGDVIRLKFGSQDTVFVHGYKAIHDTFVKNADVTSDRPHWLPSLKETLKEGNGVIWRSGNTWKILRRFALRTLRDFGVGKTSLEDKIFVEIDDATDYFAEAAGKPADVRRLTSMMITNIIYGIVFNKRFCYTDKKFHEIIENLDLLFASTGLVFPRVQFPKLLMKLIARKHLEIIEKKRKAVSWIRKHIYKEISDHETTFDSENIRDFVDHYLESKINESESDLFKVGNMFRIIQELFVAGSETTSNTINWSILYMMEYPDVQKKCQDIIHEAYGNKPITLECKGRLPYVEATLFEIQRMANVAEFSLPHTTEVDTTIQGYFIPKHTLIHANLYSSNMDPRNWDQPETFNPDRFIEGGKLKKHPALIPFSIGPRVCMGESLAKMEIFLIFTNLLQRFTFEREDANIKHSMERILTQNTSAPLAYKTRAIKRV